VLGALFVSVDHVWGNGNVVDVYIRTLARAAEIVGGPQELAFRLKVTPSHLSLWMGGLEPCPGHVFLMAVDLVLEREIALQKTPPVPKAEVAPTGESPSVN
jgi:DNA-binding transcriptional regulator YdaS (Cro superfamily)